MLQNKKLKNVLELFPNRVVFHLVYFSSWFFLAFDPRTVDLRGDEPQAFESLPPRKPAKL